MIKQRIFAGTLLAGALLLPACGVLFNSGPAKVTFTSSPDGAEVWINGMRHGITPVVVDLAKDREYTVVFKKPGHKDVVTTITKKVSPGILILDVLAIPWLVPIVVDAATGSWFVLSTSSVHGSLDPTTEGSPRGTLTSEQLERVRQGVPVHSVIDRSPRPGEMRP